VSANLPVDRVIGVGWGLSPRASSLNLPLRKKLQSVLNFGQNVSWNLTEMEIMPADLLDTLNMDTRVFARFV